MGSQRPHGRKQVAGVVLGVPEPVPRVPQVLELRVAVAPARQEMLEQPALERLRRGLVSARTPRRLQTQVPETREQQERREIQERPETLVPLGKQEQRALATTRERLGMLVRPEGLGMRAEQTVRQVPLEIAQMREMSRVAPRVVRMKSRKQTQIKTRHSTA